MKGEEWLKIIQKAKKTCLLQDKTKKVHYQFDSGQEMVEEYNTDTNVLTRRMWKIKNELGAEGKWEVEIGDPLPELSEKTLTFDTLGLKESSTAPFVTRRITKTNLEWRIRNLPYTLDTYSVTADKEQKCLTVRTTNKKYFKKLSIPELERVGLLPEQEHVEFIHKYNTLIITYKKPREVIDLEKAVLKEVEQLKPRNEGEMDCKPS